MNAEKWKGKITVRISPDQYPTIPTPSVALETKEHLNPGKREMPSSLTRRCGKGTAHLEKEKTD